MDCTAATPGHCETCNRIVRWADIQSCRRVRKLSAPLWPSGCLDCLHASEPLRDSSGAIIGSKGCGCTPESAGSGNVWVRCELKNGPVLESIGTRCVRKTLSDKG